MNKFFLLEFQPEDAVDSENSGLFGRFAQRIKNFFSRAKPVELVETMEINGELAFGKVKMPCSLKHYLEDSTKCNRIIRSIKEDIQRGMLIMPQQVPDHLLPPGASKAEGKLLNKAMMIGTLRNIFEERGIKISDLDITIIYGKNLAALRDCMAMLCPLVKYLTVAGLEAGAMESEFDAVYSETGLSVGIASDPRRAVKKSDVIINLGDMDDIFGSWRINTDAVIINYGTPGLCAQGWDGVLINGIVVKLPASLAAKLGRRIIEDYGAAQLAEILLTQKLMQEGLAAADDLHTLQRLETEFYRLGCTLSGFTGRHSIISNRDIRLRRRSHSAG